MLFIFDLFACLLACLLACLFACLFDCSVVCVCAKEHLQEFGMRKIKTERFMKSLNELKSEHIKLLCCLLLLLLLLFVLMLCVCA